MANPLFQEAQDRISTLRTEARWGIGMSDLKEALEIIIETIEDEDFQPLFDQKNFMVGLALLGNLNRIHDAIVKAAAELARLRGIEKAAIAFRDGEDADAGFHWEALRAELEKGAG